MKRFYFWLLAMVIALALCACGKPAVYDVVLDEGTFTVDTENETITYGTYVIQYDLTGKSGGVRTQFTYPNGSTFYWESSGGMGHGGWSDGYDEARYVAGETLLDVLEAEAEEAAHGAYKLRSAGMYIGAFLIGLLFVAIGTLYVRMPQKFWRVRWGWQYKNAQPSEKGLEITRSGGIGLIVLGTAVMVCAVYLLLT